MNYQASWQEKAKKLPEEIFSRLGHANNHSLLKRALLLGRGTESFLSDSKLFIPPAWKLFLSGSNMPLDHSTTQTENLIHLKGQSIKHLTSFPTDIFDVIISLWDLSIQSNNNISYMKNIHRLLKNKGQCGIITCLDGSPELPLDIIKRIIHQKKLPLKIFKSTLPDSPGSFRKMLNKTGFGDVRIWKDSIVCAYQSAEDLYNDIFPASPIPTPSVRDGEGRSADEGNLFMDNTTDEQRIIIKEEFIRKVREYSFPLEISYDFAGGVGVKP